MKASIASSKDKGTNYVHSIDEFKISIRKLQRSHELETEITTYGQMWTQGDAMLGEGFESTEYTITGNMSMSTYRRFSEISLFKEGQLLVQWIPRVEELRRGHP